MGNEILLDESENENFDFAGWFKFAEKKIKPKDIESGEYKLSEEEINTLKNFNEYRKIESPVKRFWTASKNGYIDYDAFSSIKAQLPFDVRTNLFDGNKLKGKWTYGKIKELDQDDWSVKALLRLWVLQFINQAKEIPFDELRSCLFSYNFYKEKAELENKFKDIQNIINDNKSYYEETISEIIDSTTIKNKLEKALKEIKEIYDLRNTLSLPNEKEPKDLSSYLDEKKIEVKLEMRSSTWGSLKVNIQLGGEGGFTFTKDYTNLEEFTKLSKEEIKNLFREDLEKGPWEFNGRPLDKYEEILNKLRQDKQKQINDQSIGDALQAKVDRGEELTEQDYKPLRDMADSIRTQATKEWDSWKNYRYDDGDSELAYLTIINKGAEKLSNCLIHCNYEIIDKDSGNTIARYEADSDFDNHKLLDGLSSYIEGSADIRIYAL